MQTELILNRFFKDKAPSSTLAINEAIKARWASGERVFHMGFGESRFSVHPKLQEALVNESAQKSYISSKGLAPLCRAVSAYYSEKLGLKFSDDQVMIGPGSKALLYALQLAFDADLFLPSPSWVSYAPQAELLENKHYYIPAIPGDDYRFDLAAFDQLIRKSPGDRKILIINSPNNPTGQMYTESFLKDLAEFCRHRNIWVISDEIYFLTGHGDIEHCTIGKFYPEGTVILGGLSKHLSLGGWRVGVALFPKSENGKKLMAAMMVIASEIWSSVSSSVQYAAIAAYNGDNEIESYIHACTDMHGIRTRFIYRGLTALGVIVSKPRGAFYVVANFDKWSDQLRAAGVVTSAQLASHLLENYAIASLSADSFGIDRETLSLRLASSYLDMEKDTDSDRLMRVYSQGLSEEEFMSEKHHPNSNAVIAQFARFVKDLSNI